MTKGVDMDSEFQDFFAEFGKVLALLCALALLASLGLAIASARGC